MQSIITPTQESLFKLTVNINKLVCLQHKDIQK